MLTEAVKKKWAPVIEAEGAGKISDRHIRNTTIRLLENTVKEGIIQDLTINEADGFGTGTGVGQSGMNSDTPQAAGSGKYDPVLITMIRRAMPSLIANDIVGVQPMSGPTGLIFSMQPKYDTTKGGITADDDAFGTVKPDAGYSGDGTDPYTTAAGEGLDQTLTVNAASASTTEPVAITDDWANMSFTISSTSVAAKTRALKAHYTNELAQDLRVVHGLDAEQELAAMLSTEMIAEINQEILAKVRSEAKAYTTSVEGFAATAGAIDAAGAAFNSRWDGETYAMISHVIERVANKIALETRRGRGNFVITSGNVAAALSFGGRITNEGSRAAENSVRNWDAGATYVGNLASGIRVYVDPYLTTDEIVVGYKGSNPYDAGWFYCPYVPLQMYKAQSEDGFQPRIGFKTRYGMVGNPHHTGAGVNAYYRKFSITNL